MYRYGYGVPSPQKFSGPVVFEAESNTLIAAMATQPSDDRKILINTLIASLKGAGIWAKLDILYVTAAHAQQASHLNWKNPSQFALVPVNAPTFTVDRGYQGNGTTSRLGTGGWIPGTNGVNFAVNDASLWSWTTTNLQADQFDIGARSDANVNRAEIGPWSVAGRLNNFMNSNNNGQQVVTGSLGMSGSMRTSSTVTVAWRNGVSLGAATATATARPTIELWLCGTNPAFSTRQIAFGAAGAALTGLEPQFYNAVRAYMTGVGIP